MLNSIENDEDDNDFPHILNGDENKLGLEKRSSSRQHHEGTHIKTCKTITKSMRTRVSFTRKRREQIQLQLVRPLKTELSSSVKFL